MTIDWEDGGLTVVDVPGAIEQVLSIHKGEVIMVDVSVEEGIPEALARQLFRKSVNKRTELERPTGTG